MQVPSLLSNKSSANNRINNLPVYAHSGKHPPVVSFSVLPAGITNENDIIFLAKSYMFIRSNLKARERQPAITTFATNSVASRGESENVIPRPPLVECGSFCRGKTRHGPEWDGWDNRETEITARHGWGFRPRDAGWGFSDGDRKRTLAGQHRTARIMPTARMWRLMFIFAFAYVPRFGSSPRVISHVQTAHMQSSSMMAMWDGCSTPLDSLAIVSRWLVVWVN